MSTLRAFLWLLIASLGGVAAGVLLLNLILQQRVRTTKSIAIAEDAPITELVVALKKPIELDGLTKAEVYDLRTSAVMAYPDLITESYRPSEVVFGQLVDGLPWWGLKGYAFYGSGERSIDG